MWLLLSIGWVPYWVPPGRRNRPLASRFMSDTDLPARVKDKVCIVGFADTRRIVPFDNPDFEFWGINALHRAPDLPGPHWDRWFQLHDIAEHHGKDEQDLANHLEFLSTLKCPVYVRPQDLGAHPIPTQTAYPLQQVVGRFPRYFNNTISYLIALAILMEYREIHLYGVDMAQDALTGAEFAQQRPSCEFFLGVAMGAGITIHVARGSDLLRTSHLYGFEDGSIIVQKHQARLNELGHRKEQLKAELAQLDGRRTQLLGGIQQTDGAMQDNEYWLRTWDQQPHEVMPLSDGLADDTVR